MLLNFQPFNATRINASAIFNRVTELEKANVHQEKAGFSEEFEVKLRFLMYSISLIALYLCLKDLNFIQLKSPGTTTLKN